MNVASIFYSWSSKTSCRRRRGSCSPDCFSSRCWFPNVAPMGPDINYLSELTDFRFWRQRRKKGKNSSPMLLRSDRDTLARTTANTYRASPEPSLIFPSFICCVYVNIYLDWLFHLWSKQLWSLFYSQAWMNKPFLWLVSVLLWVHLG